MKTKASDIVRAMQDDPEGKAILQMNRGEGVVFYSIDGKKYCLGHPKDVAEYRQMVAVNNPDPSIVEKLLYLDYCSCLENADTWLQKQKRSIIKETKDYDRIREKFARLGLENQ